MLPETESGFGEVQPTPTELVDRRFTSPDPMGPPGSGRFEATVVPVPDDVAARSTWHDGCPVTLDELRYVTASFWGFDQRPHTGELLVEAEYADDVAGVFESLYAMRFPIEEMRVTRADELDPPPTGDGNNTESFVCRPATGGTSLVAARLRPGHRRQPVPQPICPGRRGAARAGVGLPRPGSWAPGMVVAGDVVVEALRRHRMGVGRDWTTLKDYQHFSDNGR